MYPIFISYRRSDLSLEAEWIYNLICTFFGVGVVFFDRNEIEPGQRWDESLRSCVGSANIVLVLIGQRWLYEQLTSGMRRLDDPEDWVRKEVATAIRRHTNAPNRVWVFPILINGAKLPDTTWLPTDIANLPKFQIGDVPRFDIKNFADTALALYNFIAKHLDRLPAEVLHALPARRPFQQDLVPNPYDISGYQLPAHLRISRPQTPFKGLEYFTDSDARIFFGRRQETGEIIDHFKKSRNLLRVYGQSGVGKSSLLYAGLFPRMKEKGWHVEYFRRDPAVPLGKSLHRIIDALQNHEGNKLIVLDQVEEIITNPNGELTSEDELRNLATEIGNLNKAAHDTQNTTALILSYRKEYDVNIKAALNDQHIISDEYWLKDLSKTGMREAITGITLDQDLNNGYHLGIETGLADTIIYELLGNGRAEDSTPLLQILLRKMWDKVEMLDKDQRIFSKDLYENCKSHDLGALLKERFETIEKNGTSEIKSAVTSGLALDVLQRFTTAQDTAMALGEAALLQQYDQSDTIRRILQALVDVYLLMRTMPGEYKLPHDTLAKAVRLHYNNSQLPGQRAAFLLDSKKYEIEHMPNDVEFSKADLAIIDGGKAGMRKRTTAEAKEIEESREKIMSAERAKKRSARILATVAAIFIIVVSGMLGYVWRENKISRSNFLLSEARHALEQGDATVALRLAEASMSLHTDSNNLAFAHSTYVNGSFYRCIFSVDSGDINRVAFSHDAKFVLTSLQNNTVRLCTVAGELVEKIGIGEQIANLTFSPDDKTIYTVSNKGIQRWNLKAKLLHTLAIDSGYFLFTSDFSKDGKYLVCAEGGSELRLYNLQTNSLSKMNGYAKNINSVKFSPNCHELLVGSRDSTAYLVDLSGHLVQAFNDPSKSLYSIGFSSGGDTIFTTGSKTAIVSLWDRKAEPVMEFICGIDEGISAVFSPDGKYLLTWSAKGSASLRNLRNSVVQEFDKVREVSSVAFSPDGTKVLIAAEQDSGCVWDIKEHATLEFGDYSSGGNTAFTLAVSPVNKELLVCGDRANSILGFDGKLVSVLERRGQNIYDAAFSSDGNTLATVGYDDSVHLWNRKGKHVYSFKAHHTSIRSVKFSPDGTQILTGSIDSTAVLSDLKGHIIRKFSDHSEEVFAVSFSPDANTIFTATQDSTVHAWSMKGEEKWKVKINAREIVYAAFSPDSKHMLFASNDAMTQVLDLKTHKISRFSIDVTIEVASFSPDGNYILIGGYGGFAGLYDLQGQLLQKFKGHSDDHGRGSDVSAVAFSRDGKYVFIGVEDNIVSMYKVMTVPNYLKSDRIAPLTFEQKKRYGID